MRLNEIYDTYKDNIEFFLVYIREAHPADGWQTPENLYDEVIFDAPKTDDERAEIARVCRIERDIRLPMLLDTVDDDIESKYISKPIRLFVIDRDGRIAFNGAPGPRGFDPEAWEAAIREQIDA